MPSLLEIIERPAHKAGTIIITGIFTLLVAAVIWACLSKIDIVTTSTGSVQPVGNVNVVEAAASGTVKSINVTEGQFVKEGDILVELDSQSIEIDAGQLNKQIDIFKTQIKVYNMIKSGKTSSDIDISKYSDELKPFVQVITDTDISYHNNLSQLENEKSNADLNYQIAQLQLEETQESGTSRQIKAQELAVDQRKNELDM